MERGGLGTVRLMSTSCARISPLGVIRAVNDQVPFSLTARVLLKEPPKTTVEDGLAVGLNYPHRCLQQGPQQTRRNRRSSPSEQQDVVMIHTGTRQGHLVAVLVLALQERQGINEFWGLNYFHI
jgi:hypothetical protein